MRREQPLNLEEESNRAAWEPGSKASSMGVRARVRTTLEQLSKHEMTLFECRWNRGTSTYLEAVYNSDPGLNFHQSQTLNFE